MREEKKRVYGGKNLEYGQVCKNFVFHNYFSLEKTERSLEIFWDRKRSSRCFDRITDVIAALTIMSITALEGRLE